MRAAALFLALTVSAEAHDWYPTDCCHEDHCFQTTKTEVTAVVGGWWVWTSKEFIPLGDVRVRYHTHDRFYHRCTNSNKDRQAITNCFFVPGGQS